jgi:hypothetical protein
MSGWKTRRPAVLVAACAAVLGTMSACQSPPQQRVANPIMVEDHTGAAWPVAAAVASWGLPNVRYGPCNPFGRCVRVYEVGYLGAGGAGRFIIGLTRTSAPGVATIQLADFPGQGLPYWNRREAACHELGHAWGLGHDGSGCMETPDSGRLPNPSSWERSAARAATR